MEDGAITLPSLTHPARNMLGGLDDSQTEAALRSGRVKTKRGGLTNITCARMYYITVTFCERFYFLIITV